MVSSQEIEQRRSKVMEKKFQENKKKSVIARELGVSTQTVRRDLEAIHEREFSDTLDKKAKEILAEFSLSLKYCIRTAAKIRNDESNSTQDRLRASKQVVEFQKDKIEKMQELGFAPKSPKKVQHQGKNIKVTFEDPEEIRERKQEEKEENEKSEKVTQI